jgi:hypothetical protein
MTLPKKKESKIMKKRLLIFIIFTTLITSFSIYFTINTNNFNREKLNDSIILCLTTEWSEGAILPNGVKYKLSEDELPAKLKCINDISSNIKTLKYLETNVKNIINAANQNTKYSYLCHDFLHELGSYGYLKFKQDSLILGLDSCGWGYYHGAMLMSLKNISPNKVAGKITELKEFCYRLAHEPSVLVVSENRKKSDFDQYADVGVDGNNEFSKPYFIDYSKFTFCGHGIGHAIGESFDTLEELTNYCSTLYDIKKDPGYELMQRNVETELTGIGAELNGVRDIGTKIDDECFSGAMNSIMIRNLFNKENVAFKNLKNGSFDNIENILSQCSVVTPINGRLVSNCIRYAIAYSDILKIEDIINFCSNLQINELNDFITNGCYAGLGQKASNSLFDINEADLEEKNNDSILRRKDSAITKLLIDSCSTEEKGYCVERFTLETLQLIRDSRAMVNICNEVPDIIHKETCLRAVSIMGTIQDK